MSRETTHFELPCDSQMVLRTTTGPKGVCSVQVRHCMAQQHSGSSAPAQLASFMEGLQVLNQAGFGRLFALQEGNLGILVGFHRDGDGVAGITTPRPLRNVRHPCTDITVIVIPSTKTIERNLTFIQPVQQGFFDGNS